MIVSLALLPPLPTILLSLVLKVFDTIFSNNLIIFNKEVNSVAILLKP